MTGFVNPRKNRQIELKKRKERKLGRSKLLQIETSLIDRMFEDECEKAVGVEDLAALEESRSTYRRKRVAS